MGVAIASLALLYIEPLSEKAAEDFVQKIPFIVYNPTLCSFVGIMDTFIACALYAWMTLGDIEFILQLVTALISILVSIGGKFSAISKWQNPEVSEAMRLTRRKAMKDAILDHKLGISPGAFGVKKNPSTSKVDVDTQVQA